MENETQSRIVSSLFRALSPRQLTFHSPNKSNDVIYACCRVFQEKENVTDYKEDIQALTLQIQNLVTKVSEMQNDLKKKDDKIKTLKKMVKKNSADSKGKIFQPVQVLV